MNIYIYILKEKQKEQCCKITMCSSAHYYNSRCSITFYMIMSENAWVRPIYMSVLNHVSHGNEGDYVVGEEGKMNSEVWNKEITMNWSVSVKGARGRDTFKPLPQFALSNQTVSVCSNACLQRTCVRVWVLVDRQPASVSNYTSVPLCTLHSDP